MTINKLKKKQIIQGEKNDKFDLDLFLANLKLKGSESTGLKKNFKEIDENINKSNKKVIKKNNKSGTNKVVKGILNNHGFIETISSGIITARGLQKVASGELVKIWPSNIFAIALNLTSTGVGLVLCGSETQVKSGNILARTGTLISIPVSFKALGLAINPLGFKLGQQVLYTSSLARRPIEVLAPGIAYRQPIFEPLLTGLTIIDSLVPIGRGQRELIIGDRQTGKTSIAIDAILNQTNVISVYVSIGQKCSGIAQIHRNLIKADKAKKAIIIAATASDPAPLQYLAPYSGCTIAEFFRDLGFATLIIYDDLTKHSTAYRQMSLLLRRPPGREAFPGDVFYLHSRLLERACKLSNQCGGGSLTALPIVETQAGDVSAYIPTNVISITDGQIFLDSELFNQGIRPAVNAGLSVSRVGSAAQYPAMKSLAGKLKLELAQYREMLGFIKFGSDIDAATAKLIHRGERLVELLKQPNNNPYPIELQILLVAYGTSGFTDELKLESFKKLKLFSIEIINYIFTTSFFTPVPHIIKYLTGSELIELINLITNIFISCVIKKKN